MKRLICDIKPTSTDGERVYVKDSYIDLPFFNDSEHQFVLHQTNINNGKIEKYWELQVDDETIIYVFPTRAFVYSEPNEWIGEIMNTLNIPVDSADDVFYILHDRDFMECNGFVNENQKCQFVYYIDEKFAVVNCDDNTIGNRCGKLLVFQHSMVDDFFYPIVDDDIEDFVTWNDRWNWIKNKILQW